MKNSNLLLPARFLCNTCIDHNQNDLYKCENDQIPLENVKEARGLQSHEQVKIIQKIVKEGFQIWQKDVETQNQFYFG